jgi:hypothetical protein
MKKSADHERLLQETLGEAEDLRAASLEGTLAAMRSVRRRRRVQKVIAAGALVILALVWWFRTELPRPVKTIIAKTVGPAAKVESAVSFISEDELLAQFPDRAVALVGPPTNRRLVFLDVKRR